MPLPLLIPAIQAGAGLAQSIFGGIRARKAQKELERMQSPIYSPSQSILDYYNQAKSRYSTNPYESSMYKLQSQNIQRGTAQGLNALNDRRMALAGVNSLVQGQNDALLRAGVAAEQEQGRRFGQLGQAAQLKAGEDQKMFQYNQLMPFERKSSLLGAKAAGGAATMNAGLSNIFGGLSSMGNMSLLKNLYGSGDAGATTNNSSSIGQVWSGAPMPSYYPPSKRTY